MSEKSKTRNISIKNSRKYKTGKKNKNIQVCFKYAWMYFILFYCSEAGNL